MPRSAASPYGIEMIWLVLFDLFAIEGYLLPTRSGGLLFRRVGVISDPDSSRRTGIYSADRIQGLNSVRVSCRTFHHLTAHPNFFWRAARSPRSPEGWCSMSFALRASLCLLTLGLSIISPASAQSQSVPNPPALSEVIDLAAALVAAAAEEEQERFLKRKPDLTNSSLVAALRAIDDTLVLDILS